MYHLTLYKAIFRIIPCWKWNDGRKNDITKSISVCIFGKFCEKKKDIKECMRSTINLWHIENKKWLIVDVMSICCKNSTSVYGVVYVK